MKLFRFSVRDLLAFAMIVAGVIALTSSFHSWRDGYTKTRFREFRTLDNLRSLQNGDQLSKAQLLFDNMKPLHPDLVKVILSDRDPTESDEVFTVTVNDSYARFLQFNNGVLVNYNFTAKDMQDSLSSLQAPIPQWYIQYGDWLVGLAFTLVIGLLLVVWKLVKRRNIEPAT